MNEASSSTSMVRLGSVPDGSREGLRFLQDRLAYFGRIGFLLSLGFYVVLNVARTYDPAFVASDLWLAEGNPWNLAAAAVLLAKWRIARGRALPLRTLTLLDAAGPILTGLAFTAMANFITSGHGPLDALLGLTNTVVARAVIVPSTARRTLWISAAVTLPAVAAVALALWSSAVAPDSSAVERFLRTLDALLWCGIATTVATVASKVIYGLQEKVREARQLGQYTLEERLGKGGMGAVYRARHALLRRPTAVKLMTGASEQRIARFEREVQLTSMLSHPNTISIYDYGRTPDGLFYYAMEYLEGVDLEELVRRHGRQPPGRVVHILRQIASSLAEAHGIGLIHRDIKPANVYLCSRGGHPDFVKVLDFGLVTEIDPAARPAVSCERSLTGTPLYMSPESIRSPGDIDARSDLYALGAVGYWLLTGRTVFQAGTSVEICYHHLHTRPEPPSKYVPEGVPEDVERVILDCLAKEPEARPADALTLMERLAASTAAPMWREADARRWWKEHASRRAAACEPASAGGPARLTTIDVDLRARPLPALRQDG
ncbi:serine/threonine-protein kinase [Sorangium sp. So ce260]|uniref:serine/threonine-protein kinase n=1 Tax=Sorangium sp. So ce260 TaxID=3133291 RepID=UPI003F6490DD